MNGWANWAKQKAASKACCGLAKPHQHGGRGMIVASSPVVGKSDATLIALAEDLAGFVRRSVQDGSSLDKVERGVLGKVLDMGQAAVAFFLAAQGDGDLGYQVEVED